MKEPIQVFCCYAHEDQKLFARLKRHLQSLEDANLIKVWSHADITAGGEWEKEIETHLNKAQIILLLVSPDFMASEYCSTERERALQRHEQGEAQVIPLLLRPTAWRETPLGQLQALPAKPITQWRTYDNAFLNIVQGIRKVVAKLTQKLQGNIPISHGLLEVLNKYKEMCRTRNIRFETPHLLLALLNIDNSRTLYHLDQLTPYYGTILQRRLDKYSDNVKLKYPERTFLGFQWENREDVREAQLYNRALRPHSAFSTRQTCAEWFPENR